MYISIYIYNISLVSSDGRYELAMFVNHATDAIINHTAVHTIFASHVCQGFAGHTRICSQAGRCLSKQREPNICSAKHQQTARKNVSVKMLTKRAGIV